MNKNIIIFIIITIISLLVYYFMFKENYSHIIVRIPDSTKSLNDCEYPLTNSKKNTYCDKLNSIYHYAQRPLITPDSYLDILKLLFQDLTSNKSDKLKINDLKFDTFENDDEDLNASLTQLLNNNIQDLIKTKEYLHNNGTWKYESLFIQDLLIFNSDKENTYKIVFTIGNPLRSAYTSCVGVITKNNNDNKYSIEYVNFINSFDEINDNSIKDNNLLEFSFVNQLAQIDFDKFANPIIDDNISDKIEIKADIPDEFKNGVIENLPELM